METVQSWRSLLREAPKHKTRHGKFQLNRKPRITREQLEPMQSKMESKPTNRKMTLSLVDNSPLVAAKAFPIFCTN